MAIPINVQLPRKPTMLITTAPWMEGMQCEGMTAARRIACGNQNQTLSILYPSNKSKQLPLQLLTSHQESTPEDPEDEENQNG